MKRFTLMVLALVASVGLAFGQNDEAEMMKKWQEAMTPNENHAYLAKMVGEWTYTQTSWMDPTQEPMVSQGKNSAKMIMGGRYLEEDMSGTSWGMPFEGKSITGYENQTQRFRGQWIDNMGTGFLLTEGSLENGVMTMTGSFPSLMAEGMETYRMVSSFEGDDKHKMTMYITDVDGNEMKAMEIVATRVK